MKTLEERITDAILAWVNDCGFDLHGHDISIPVVEALQRLLNAWESTSEEHD